jgi:hypothetical protein
VLTWPRPCTSIVSSRARVRHACSKPRPVCVRRRPSNPAVST